MSLLSFYLSHYAEMFEPLLETSLHGVRVDVNLIKRKRAWVDSECIAIQDELAEEFGLPLHATNDLSNTRLAKVLYGKEGKALGFPPQIKRGTGALTTDELALHKLVQRVKTTPKLSRVSETTVRWKREPEAALHALELMMKHRKLSKMRTFLDPAKIDPDGRLRCQYKVTTQTGRLASSGNPYGTGLNLQNIPARSKLVSVRETFIPDEGCVFLEVDLSQAEARLVYVLTGDDELIRLARTRPNEFDIHRANAAAIFKVAEDEVTKTQRDRGKMAIHAGHYGMRGKKLSEAMLKDGIVLDPKVADETIAAYLSARPTIPLWHHSVRTRIYEMRELTTSWGRRLSFEHDYLNDETYRKGYAFQPQSEIGDLLNQFGFKPLFGFIRDRGLKSRINLQVHDALVISCPLNELHEVCAFLIEQLEKPRLYQSPVNGVVSELSVPAEPAIGTCWDKGKLRGWKYCPTREEIENAALEMAPHLRKGKI